MQGFSYKNSNLLDRCITKVAAMAGQSTANKDLVKAIFARSYQSDRRNVTYKHMYTDLYGTTKFTVTNSDFALEGNHKKNYYITSLLKSTFRSRLNVQAKGEQNDKLPRRICCPVKRERH